MHVRHNPPLSNRPWVLTEAGRRRFLGYELECKLCEQEGNREDEFESQRKERQPSMTEAQAIALALAAAAAARLRANKMEEDWPVIDVYQELQALLAESYPGVDASLMEIGPASKERKELLAQQIGESGADDDEEVLALSRRLLQEIETHVPQAAVAAGIDVVNLGHALAALGEDGEEAD